MHFIGLDVHATTTAITVRNSRGAIIRRSVVPTTREALRAWFHTIRGKMLIACEASPLSWWIATLLATRLRKIIVCDPRQIRRLQNGAKTDRVDADNLSELLRLDALRPVYVGDRANRGLRTLVAHYLSVVNDRRRIIQRLRSLFHELAIPIERDRNRPERVPLRRLSDSASRFVTHARIEQLAAITLTVHDARAALIEAAKPHPAFELLQTIPYIGPMRAAELIAIVGTPTRFSSLRQFWAYAGLAVVRRVSSEHRLRDGQVVRDQISRGLHLNSNRHPRLKKIFKDVALQASIRKGEFREIYDRLTTGGKQPAIARVALARKIAAILLGVWKSGKPFDLARIK